MRSNETEVRDKYTHKLIRVIFLSLRQVFWINSDKTVLQTNEELPYLVVTMDEQKGM